MDTPIGSEYLQTAVGGLNRRNDAVYWYVVLTAMGM